MFSKQAQTGHCGKGKIKITTADKWFSIYIRLRDIIYSHFSKCITCGSVFHWRDLDCGHFVHRDRPMTRFNEQNCHAQCKSCNRFQGGMEYEHGTAIDRLYGAGTALKLKQLGGIRGQKIHGLIALQDITKEYKIKARKLAKKLDIKI